MTEDPQITVRKAQAWTPFTPELLAEAESLRAGLGNLLDPMRPTPPPSPDPGPNPAYVRLLEAARAASPALAELVELHKPKPLNVHLDGNDYAEWPTDTDTLIAQHLGVDLEAS